MRFDFTDVPVNGAGFSRKPMTFWDTKPKDFFSAVIDLVAVETGDRKARNNWQAAQIKNLIKHAHDRSAFWRKRLGTKKIGDVKLADIPILTQRDVRTQVNAEGALLGRRDGLRVKQHLTSGSSGVPIELFVSEMNGFYNHARDIAQFFLEGRELRYNRTTLRSLNDSDVQASPKSESKGGLEVKVSNSWLAPLDGLFDSGIHKSIHIWRPSRDRLVEELSKHPIGYFVVPPSFIEVFFGGPHLSDLMEMQISMLVPFAGKLDPSIRQRFIENKIPVRGNYFSEEVGLIGAECAEYPEHYHVAESNVVVEIDNTESECGKQSGAGRILVTHLHSYATPLIRYDIGDLGALMHTCKCGHDGPAVLNLSRTDLKIAEQSRSAINVE